ncbi:histidine kinase [Spongiactinospora sp. TRM90649]|uniref:sensor histidine kinase n=1 Tax=Spongiactinospora sp. TRM90649 TaxID=3031114 RepID=UPI0023F7A1AA|nr:histidine kinase [Spongiactinospora sp. TRM90649]MDF5751152.1 histidine kinase [Spongiactinospora sp. TRM90649]
MSFSSRLDEAERAMASLDLQKILRSPLLDVAIGAALTVFVLNDRSYYGMPELGASLLATAPQMVRRRFRVGVLVLTALGAGILVAIGELPEGANMAVYLSGVLSTYTLLTLLPRYLRWAGGLSAAAGAVLLTSGYPGTQSLGLLVAVTITAVTFLADLRGSRVEIGRVKADHLEQVRERAAMAERARIAREMHDVVAHSVSMIAVRAETAPFTLAEAGETLGEATRGELADIAANARDALAEMRRLLGVLRADIPDGPETAPQPGLSRLPELIESHPGEVDLDVIGEERPLPQAVDVNAYRIVQEALANARVHAPGSRVSIELAYRPTLLAIRVADSGPESGTGGAGGVDDAKEAVVMGEESTAKAPEEGEGTGGHGLIGMRERALALGGWFNAGPGPHGGFLVQAGLPTE